MNLVLYYRFNSARQAAIALTDQYRKSGPDDPDRRSYGRRAMLQTERARLLREAWLNRAISSPSYPLTDVLESTLGEWQRGFTSPPSWGQSFRIRFSHTQGRPTAS